MSLTLDKIKLAYSVKTNNQLAEKLNTTQGAVEGWARRKEVPHKYLIQCTLDTGVSLDWLLDENKPTFNINQGSSVSASGRDYSENGLKKEQEIDETTLSLFKEAYLKAKNNNNLKGLRVHLLDFNDYQVEQEPKVKETLTIKEFENMVTNILEKNKKD